MSAMMMKSPTVIRVGREKAEVRVLGSAGVPPAVACVPRATSRRRQASRSRTAVGNPNVSGETPTLPEADLSRRWAFRLIRLQWMLRFAALCASVLAFVCARADDSGPKPPDRRELWVPMDELGRVLNDKAVLLSREQYDALLRDSGIDKPAKHDAPAGAVLSSAIIRAVPEGKTASIHTELIVNVLRDGWAALPLEFAGAEIGDVKSKRRLDGEAVLVPKNAALRTDAVPANQKAQAAPQHPATLLLRGRGEHRITLELTALIASTAGVNSLALTVPNVASGTFTLALPAGATMEKSERGMKVSTTADATTATLALSPATRSVAFAWKNGAAANDAQVPVRVGAKVRYNIDAEKVAGTSLVRIESALGDLPASFEFSLPPEVKVLAVHADELRGWEAAGGKVTVNFQPGARKALDLQIDTELAALAGKDSATVALPLPVLAKVPRLDGVLFVEGSDDVIVKEIAGDAALRRVPTAEDRGEREFFGAYEFSGRAAAPRVTIERALPRLEADLDTLVEFRSDAIFFTRTITLREQKGRRFSAAITLPAGEELLDVRRISELAIEKQKIPGLPSNEEANQESEPEWTQEAGRVLIKWSDESAKPRVFRLRSRVEPEKWTQLPPEGISLALGDAKIADAAKVAGYIALIADPAFRLEAQPGETLERRDGRSTPVQGDYAWFRRDAFDLKVKIARRPAEVLAALTGYALPLEGVLDMHASMNYRFLGGGTRSVRIRVPKDLAQNFHFDGPQIAERVLAEDVWTVTFQKELTGAYALAITAQVPVAKQAGDENGAKNGNKNGNRNGNGGAKGYSFAVKVPVISPLDVVRASGLWAVEANTETEIRFDARGMNELDSLLAPQLADYAPRHRVIGVFGWLGADYALTLNGVRHAAAGMLTAVVDALELNTVISTSGLHRHEAVYRLRASGVAYLDVALPPGAQLLSVAIDGAAVKPVADRPGSVRLPLPAKRDANTGVVASLVYETGGDAWKNRGTLALAAPVIAKEFPVLKSSWRVWVPDGFSFSEIESNLPVPEVVPEELLVRTIGRRAIRVIGAPFLPVFASAQKRAPVDFAMTEQSESTVVQQREGVVATGRMMVSGQFRMGDSAAVYSEELVNFFGTQIELMQSAEISKRAHARVHSLHPDLPHEEVKLEVMQVPKASVFILKAYGRTPEYAQAFLNACMDEYIATKKEMRSQKNESTTVVVQDTLVRLEKDMQNEEDEMHEFQKANSIGVLNEEGKSVGVYLAQLSRQMADLKAEFDSLEPQKNIPSNKRRRETIRVQIANLQSTIKQWEAKTLDLAKRVAEYDKIKSKIERTKSQYDRLLATMRSVDVQKGLDPDAVSILERASLPASVMAAEEREMAKRKAGQIALEPKPPDEPPGKTSTAAITHKLESIVFPKINFTDATVREAVEWLATKSKDLDADGQGVNIVLKLGDEELNKTRITLTLNNVPLIEVIKYVTNLANLKYKVEPFAVTIVPLGTSTEELYIKEWKVPPSLFPAASESKGLTGGLPAGVAGTPSARDFLAASGVTFGQGAFAMYSPVSNSLVVKGTQDQLDLVERIIEVASSGGDVSALASKFKSAMPSASALAGRGGQKTAGLLPVTLDLPKNGRALVFAGLYAPERLVMRYDDWWSRARRLWMWFVGGGLAFYFCARRKPCWGTLWAVLVLSALPLCVSAAWMPVCNALLGGWIAGLVLNRIAAWCVFRREKEVLA